MAQIFKDIICILVSLSIFTTPLEGNEVGKRSIGKHLDFC